MVDLSEPKIILIGGTSHTGKSTLAKVIAAKLNGKYIATDSLARHPGRPWTNEKDKTVKHHVLEHYHSLSVSELMFDVMAHYRQNVVSQVENIIQTHLFSSLEEYLVIEGSAIYPSLVAGLAKTENVMGIWLIANHSLLKNRIYHSSDFHNRSKAEQSVIYKFLGRTWLFNRGVVNDAQSRVLTVVDVSSEFSIDELVNRCLLEINI